jgi:hypothetical protein
VTPYEPPNGIADLVWLLQHCTPDEAARVLALTFRDCAAAALLQDVRLHVAAPTLLAACKAALATAETGRALDWPALTAAVAQAEPTERPDAMVPV